MADQVAVPQDDRVFHLVGARYKASCVRKFLGKYV